MGFFFSIWQGRLFLKTVLSLL